MGEDLILRHLQNLARSNFFLAAISICAFAQNPPTPPTVPSVPELRFRCEAGLSSGNDADFLGGNDYGWSFGNNHNGLVKEERDGDRGPREIDYSVGTDFFSRAQINHSYDALNLSKPVYLRDDKGRIYIDFSEEFRFSLGLREWLEKSENNFYELRCDLAYESDNRSITGTELQNQFHRAVGVRASPTSYRAYNYTSNQRDVSRFRTEISCRRGLRYDLNPSLPCETYVGTTLSSVGIANATADFGGRLMIHTPVSTAFDHDRPSFAFFGRFDCRRDLDFENRNFEIAAGAQANIPFGRNREKYLSCSLEWAKHLDVNSQAHGGLLEGDDIVTLSFAIGWHRKKYPAFVR